MRIALIEPSGQRGLAHYAYCLGNALVRRNHQVVLLTTAGHETASLPETYATLEVFARFRTNPAQLLRALVALRRRGVDVVHFHGAIHPELYVPLLGLIRAVVRCPVVYTAHDILPWKHPLARGALGRLLSGPITGLVYRLADAVIVHAAENRARVLDRFSLRPDAVHVVPHGSYSFLELLGTETPRQSGRRRPTALFFGIIVESKGLMPLIHAFRRVVALVPSSRLVVAGQPFQDCRAYLEEIERLGLSDHVETDFRYIPMTEIPHYFRSADIVVLPYRTASQSGVLQVAYAFARPVVATAVGGLTEVVEHRKSGILVPPGDEGALADAIIELLTDDPLRGEMGTYARTLADGPYSWEVIAAATERIYASAE